MELVWIKIVFQDLGDGSYSSIHEPTCFQVTHRDLVNIC